MGLEEMDGKVFDPETGEVYDIEDAREDQIKIYDLPKTARNLKALRSRMMGVEAYRESEMNRINEICDAKRLSQGKQEEYLLTRAEELFRETDGSTIDYGGLGKFRDVKGREYTSTEGYDGMDKEKQLEVREAYPQFFKTKKTVKPDLTEIKARIKEGTTTISGFSVERRNDRFEFKEEL